MLVLGTKIYLLQRVGGAGGPYRSEHVAVVRQRVHPGYRHLPWRQQYLVTVLHLFLLQGETETTGSCTDYLRAEILPIATHPDLQ